MEPVVQHPQLNAHRPLGKQDAGAGGFSRMTDGAPRPNRHHHVPLHLHLHCDAEPTSHDPAAVSSLNCPFKVTAAMTPSPSVCHISAIPAHGSSCSSCETSELGGFVWPAPYGMASSEVDQKFLGRLARAVEHDNPLLSSILFKILGLSLNLAEQLVAAKKQRKPDPTAPQFFLKRVLHIIWLAREGLVMLQQYVIPMVGNYVELKVLAYKLRASFHHIFVLFHNQPPVSDMTSWTPELMAAASEMVRNADQGLEDARPVLLMHSRDGGPVGPPPGFEPHVALLPPSFLLPSQDYLPTAHQYFKEAVGLADELLWGSHSLRLSVKTEYAAFLYDCLHDADASRELAKDTIAEVYDATEGVDDDMFRDACELVTVLGKMMTRGLGSKGPSDGKASASKPPLNPMTMPPSGMENAI